MSEHTTTPVTASSSTDDPTTGPATAPVCANPYPLYKAGNCVGSPRWAVLLGSGKRSTVISPLCWGHADYELAWRKAVGAIAKGRIIGVDDIPQDAVADTPIRP